MASSCDSMTERFDPNAISSQQKFMRKLILWLILTAFISGLALEAAQPVWTPARGRGHAIVKIKKIKKRHARKKKRKKRVRRRRRRTTAAVNGASWSVTATSQPHGCPPA